LCGTFRSTSGRNAVNQRIGMIATGGNADLDKLPWAKPEGSHPPI
jgi:hypothetical protein